MSRFWRQLWREIIKLVKTWKFWWSVTCYHVFFTAAHFIQQLLYAEAEEAEAEGNIERKDQLRGIIIIIYVFVGYAVLRMSVDCPCYHIGKLFMLGLSVGCLVFGYFLTSENEEFVSYDIYYYCGILIGLLGSLISAGFVFYIYGDNEKPGCPTLPLFGIAGSLFAVIVGYIISIVSNSGGMIGYWNMTSLIIGAVGLFSSCNFLLILFLSESRYSRERVRNQHNSDSPKETKFIRDIYSQEQVRNQTNSDFHKETKTVMQIYSGERVRDQHNPDLPKETKINETYSLGGVRNKYSYLPKETNTVNEIYSREQVRNPNNSDSHKETKTVRRIHSGERLRNQHYPELPKKSKAVRQICSGERVRNQHNPDLPKKSKGVGQIYSQEVRNQYNSESPKETKTVSKIARNEIPSPNLFFTESPSNKRYSDSKPLAGSPNSDASDDSIENLYGKRYTQNTQNSPESEYSQNSPESEYSQNSPESEYSQNSPESEYSQNSPESEFRLPPYGEDSYEDTNPPQYFCR